MLTDTDDVYTAKHYANMQSGRAVASPAFIPAGYLEKAPRNTEDLDIIGWFLLSLY